MVNILVVDDSKLARKRIQDILEQTEIKYNLQKASDGLEALEILDNNPIDFLITDIEMPKMDGIALMEEIGNRDIDIKILAVSSIVKPTILQFIKNNKNVYFLKKPFNFEQFKKLLNDILYP